MLRQLVCLRFSVYGRLLRSLALLALVGGPEAALPQLFAQAAPAGTGRPLTDLYGDPLPRRAIARMGTMRFWTGLDIRSICFAPDGKTLASRSSGSLAIGTAVWEANGRLVRTLKPTEGDDDVWEMAFSPDGRSLAGCDLGFVTVWEIATGRAIHVFRCEPEDAVSHTWAHKPTFAAHSSEFAAYTDGTIRLWNLATGAEIRRVKVTGGIGSSFALSPDGRILAVGALDGGTTLWDVGTGKVREKLPFLKRHWLQAFSPDGVTLTSVGGQNVTVWDLATHQLVRRVGLEAVKPTPVVEAKQPVPVAEAAKHELVIDDKRPPRTAHSVLSGDGATVAEADVTGSISIWETGTGRLIRRIHVEPTEASACLALSHDGKRVASTSGYTTLRLWDIASGQAVGPYPRHLGPVLSIALSSDQNVLVSAGEDYTIRIWDAKSGREIRWIRDGPPEVWRSRDDQDEPRIHAISPTGQIALSGDGREVISPCWDGTVRFWETGSGQESRRIRLEGIQQLDAIVFSSDRATVAALAEGTFGLWDLATGKRIREAAAADTVGDLVTFSRDGRMIAGRFGTCLWESRTLHLIKKFDASFDAEAIDFSPDGKSLCLADSHGALIFTDLDGRNLHRSPIFFDHTKTESPSARSVVFSPEGDRVAWAGDDGFVRIWDVAQRRLAAQLEGHRGGVNQVLFGRTSRYIVSAGDDGSILTWDVPPLGRP
jgi:WD40 repeat protein